jgi:hypothetical protein
MQYGDKTDEGQVDPGRNRMTGTLKTLRELSALEQE